MVKMLDKIIKNRFLLIFIILAISGLFFCFFFQNHSVYENKIEKIEIKGKELQLEIAKTEKEREVGLSGRKSLCENCGMLFVFPEEGKQGFWMKGMKFNLDIVWINNGKIVYIAKNVSYNLKETIRPDVLANKVLELNAGMVEELNIKIGDEIKF